MRKAFIGAAILLSGIAGVAEAQLRPPVDGQSFDFMHGSVSYDSGGFQWYRRLEVQKWTSLLDDAEEMFVQVSFSQMSANYSRYGYLSCTFEGGSPGVIVPGTATFDIFVPDTTVANCAHEGAIRTYEGDVDEPVYSDWMGSVEVVGMMKNPLTMNSNSETHVTNYLLEGTQSRYECAGGSGERVNGGGISFMYSMLEDNFVYFPFAFVEEPTAGVATGFYMYDRCQYINTTNKKKK